MNLTTPRHHLQPLPFVYSPMQLLDTAEEIGYEVCASKEDMFFPQAKKIRLS